MKKLILIFFVATTIYSCGDALQQGKTVNSDLKNDIEQISSDTTSQGKIEKFTKLLTQTGELYEMKIYPLGSFKRIKFEVIKIKRLSSDENIEPFIKLETTYGNDYYWYTRSALMLKTEIRDYIKSVEIIRDQYLGTTPDTETVVGFIGFGDSKISANYKGGKWKCEFSVDKNNENTNVSFMKEDIDPLIEILEKVEAQADTLSKK